MNDCYIELSNQKLRFKFEKLDSDTSSISPSLIVTLLVNNTKNDIIKAMNIKAIISIYENSFTWIISQATSDRIYKFSQQEERLTLRLNIDNYILNQIEKKRNGRDINFHLDVRFYGYVNDINTLEYVRNEITWIKIPRSDWVDNILSKSLSEK